MRFCVAIIISALATQAAHWNQFRGPEGTGHVQSNLPLSWSETENVTWKTAIPGRGWSSPVLWENQIWLTTATPDGKQLTVCVLTPQTARPYISKNSSTWPSHSSPTSLTATRRPRR